MKDREQEQLDRVLSEIVDQGVSGERMSRLNDILLDRHDLQERYIEAMRVNTLLRLELGGGLQPLRPLLDALTGSKEAGAEATCEALSGRLHHDLHAPQPTRQSEQRRHSGWWLAGLAAALLLGVTIAQLWKPAQPEPNAPPRLVGVEDEVDPQATEVMLIKNTQALESLSRVTRTDPVERLLLTKGRVHGAAWKLLSGNAWIERAPEGRERGYVVVLPANSRLDLHVDADAGSTNALGLIEIDMHGRVGGNTLSFSNLMGGVAGQEGVPKYGSIGESSITNRDSTERYFLLAGSHVVPSGDERKAWKQSDYAVLHESDDFLVLGWDDSGYPGIDIQYEDGRDRDFNDIVAVLHFSSLSEEPTTQQTGGERISYSPAADPDGAVAAGPAGSGFLLDVRPREELVLSVSSDAALENKVQVIHEESGKVIWQRQVGVGGNDSTGSEIYVIRNHTPTVQRYEVRATLAGDSASEAGGVRELKHKINDQGDRWTSIGFEDNPGTPGMVDWNDIQVHARWFED